MDRSTIDSIVYKLCEDSHLVEEKARFIAALGTPVSFLTKLDRAYLQGTKTEYEYFSSLLRNWAGREETASIKELYNILYKLSFVAAAGSIKPLIDCKPTQKETVPSSLSTPILLVDQRVRMEVSKLLAEETKLLAHWEDLCTILKIPVYEADLWKKQVAMGTLTNPRLMNNIIADWASRTRAASVQSLAKILLDAEFVTVADRLNEYKPKW